MESDPERSKNTLAELVVFASLPYSLKAQRKPNIGDMLISSSVRNRFGSLRVAC